MSKRLFFFLCSAMTIVSCKPPTHAGSEEKGLHSTGSDQVLEILILNQKPGSLNTKINLGCAYLYHSSDSGDKLIKPLGGYPIDIGSKDLQLNACMAVAAAAVVGATGGLTWNYGVNQVRDIGNWLWGSLFVGGGSFAVCAWNRIDSAVTEGKVQAAVNNTKPVPETNFNSTVERIRNAAENTGRAYGPDYCKPIKVADLKKLEVRRDK